jgi:hypothetical protein
MTMAGASRDIQVVINRAVRDAPAAALYTLDVTVNDRSGEGGEALFELRFPSTGESFQRTIDLTPSPTNFWLAINTHLLPNGSNRVEATLRTADWAIDAGSFTLEVLNAGPLTSAVKASLVESSAPLVFHDRVDSESFDGAALALVPWYERDDAPERIRQLLAGGHVSALEADDLLSLVENGYVQLGWEISPDLVSAANAAIDDAIDKKFQGYEYGSSQRIELLHEHYDAIRALWKHPSILRFLSLVFDAEPLPCQTLTYVFGSEQDLHQDTIHLTSFPAGYMCGVWIALQDINKDSGELAVVPKSHRLERVYRKSVGCAQVKNGDWAEFAATVGAKWKDMFDKSGLSVETYRPRAGSVLIWLDSLLHGGSRRIDRSLTRRSVVSHYFASGSIAYYDSTGLPGYVHR